MTQVQHAAGLRASITVRRGDLQLDVALDAAPGEVLAVLGPNGSGKTTLLRVLAGLQHLDAGRVEISGTVLDDASTDLFVPAEQRGVSFVFQDLALFRHLSVLENVAFGLRARGTDRATARGAAREWLERVGLGDRLDARPHELSGGQQQRVAIARALVHRPSILLMDEPLSALDAGTRRAMRSELRAHLDQYAAAGGITVLVTHDPVDAYALADRVAVLDGGRLAQVGTIGEVTAYPRSAYVAELVGTNLFRGTCDGSAVVLPDGTRIAVVEAPVGDVFAIVRPQAVLLALEQSPAASARNVWPARVAEIVRLGERARVSLELTGAAGDEGDAGASSTMLIAEVTSGALAALGIEPGGVVVASVKATEVEVYPA
ncbi:MAG: ABC transporter ATP-binding protein [Ilumatobacteraceae bacterium]